MVRRAKAHPVVVDGVLVLRIHGVVHLRSLHQGSAVGLHPRARHEAVVAAARAAGGAGIDGNRTGRGRGVASRPRNGARPVTAHEPIGALKHSSETRLGVSGACLIMCRMKRLSLEELRRPDDRTLLFTPLGLGQGWKLAPEDSVCVPAGRDRRCRSYGGRTTIGARGLRASQEIHAYGVLCYDNYTMTAELTSVVVEQALRERFLDFYSGQVPLQNKVGALDFVEIKSFYDLGGKLWKGGSHAKGGWELRPKSPGPRIPVPTSLAPLLRWAGREGLLPGRRNRTRGSLLAEFRNDFAHGAGFRVATPVESARRISDTAEMINRLWGVSTPGGRLYPTPLRREVRVIAWSDGARTHCRPEQILLQVEEDGDDHTYVALRCVPDDPGLWDFDARYERTTYPCDFLWGPGDAESAFGWCQAQHPEPDEVEHLDRLFLVRVDERKTYLPMRPEVLAGLPPENRTGAWNLIRADFPNDAFAHVRSHGSADSVGEPPCGCPVEVVSIGGWDEVRAPLGDVVAPANPPSLRVPGLLPDAPDVGSD